MAVHDEHGSADSMMHRYGPKNCCRDGPLSHCAWTLSSNQREAEYKTVGIMKNADLQRDYFTEFTVGTVSTNLEGLRLFA